MLQHAQAISILRRAIAIDEGSFKLDFFSRSSPYSLFDMFFAIERGSKT
jgi:hypothetical protein